MDERALRDSVGDFIADCPARMAVDLLAPTWSVVVLHALREGPRRPHQLRAMIGGISAKSINDALRRLQRQGLVAHERIAEAPPRVDYRLTPLGRSLLEPIDALAGWVVEHAAELPEWR